VHYVFCSCVLDVPLVSHFTISIFGQLHSASLCIVLWPFVSSYSWYDLRSNKIFPSTIENPHPCSSIIGRTTFVPIQYKLYVRHREISMAFELNLMWYSIYKIHIISQVGLEHFTPKNSIRVIHCQSGECCYVVSPHISPTC
jgi:hypothetical protein